MGASLHKQPLQAPVRSACGACTAHRHRCFAMRLRQRRLCRAVWPLKLAPSTRMPQHTQPLQTHAVSCNTRAAFAMPGDGRTLQRKHRSNHTSDTDCGDAILQHTSAAAHSRCPLLAAAATALTPSVRTAAGWQQRRSGPPRRLPVSLAAPSANAVSTRLASILLRQAQLSAVATPHAR